MIDHTVLQLALRTQALTLSVATTGSMTLSATSTGYARTTGSFITDGFKVGMEVSGTSFTNSENNDDKVITAVTALALTAAGTVTESAATRTLTVGLPAQRLWEGAPLTPVAGRPYVVEQYIPGQMRQLTLGTLGELEVTPMYVLQFYGPANTGLGGVGDYADAILTLFAPGTSMTVGSDTLRVRRDVAPYRGQMVHAEPGWVVVPVNLPCRLRTANTV